MSAPAATYTTSILNPFLPTAAVTHAPSPTPTTSIHATRSFFDPAATGGATSSSSSTTTTKTFKQRPLSDDAGLIAGIICAIVALFFLIIILSIFFWRWQERRMVRMAPKELDSTPGFGAPHTDEKEREWGGGTGSPEWELGRGGMVIELEGREPEFELPAYTSPGAPGYEKTWEAGRKYS